MAPIGIFTFKTVGLFSETRQLRCQPALSIHSIIFTRWRQQHKNGRLTLGPLAALAEQCSCYCEFGSF